jgi:hypothetical protein
MAIYPCSQHGARYSGAQQTAYPAIVLNGNSFRERRRLCPDCMRLHMQWVETFLTDSSDPDLSPGCVLCGVEDAPFALFDTIYLKGQERQDFYGRACRAHVWSEVVEGLWGLSLEAEPPFEPVDHLEYHPHL